MSGPVNKFGFSHGVSAHVVRRVKPHVVNALHSAKRKLEEGLSVTENLRKRFHDRALRDGVNAGNNLRVGGVFRIQHIRNGVVINDFTAKNGVTNEGLNDILDVYLDAGSQKTLWYVGLIDDPATLAAGDVMNSHAGWTEATEYDETNRVTCVFEEPSGQSVSNSVTAATFTINATISVHGVFLTSDNTKSGTTGTLWATAPFATKLDLVSTDVLNVTYTVTAG